MKILAVFSGPRSVDSSRSEDKAGKVQEPRGILGPMWIKKRLAGWEVISSFRAKNAQILVVFLASERTDKATGADAERARGRSLVVFWA